MPTSHSPEVINHPDDRVELRDYSTINASPLYNENLAPEMTGEATDWLNDFRLQCERNLERSVEQRMRYGFCHTYKPVLDDAEWRSFDSTAEYRRWCRENLPVYLGFGEPDALQQEVLDEYSQLSPTTSAGSR